MNKLKNIYPEFYNSLMEFMPLGSNETKYANLIAKAPHIGTAAWLHAIYKPISKKEIDDLDRDLNLSLPTVYSNFLSNCNGFSLFVTTLSLFGYRYNNIRDLENIWQPFDIVKLNNRDRPFDSKDKYFFFGFYNWDGSLVYLDRNTLKIHRCTRDSSKALNTWDDFEIFLKSEVERISKLFNKKGIKIDEDVETTPFTTVSL